ncbi:MAG: hypothetical protein ABFD04_12310 [Syntrophomonas sp.]
MVELDFGFLSLRHVDRTGLTSQKFFLERLAPIFFPLRVARLVELPELDSRVCSMVLPLGSGNLQHLDREKRRRMLEHHDVLMNDFQLRVLAVDRRLKDDFLSLDCKHPLIFGDYFIEVLALVQIRRLVSNYRVKKIIIVGASAHFSMFLEALNEFNLPVSIQSYRPDRYEVLAYRLLYEKGCAVSTSRLNPTEWEKGDLVVALASGSDFRGYPSFCLHLGDDQYGLAPELDKRLEQSGWEGCLHHLAPLLESTMLTKAGYFESNEEPIKVSDNMLDLPYLEGLGSQMGLWDRFLDKAL